MATRDGLFPNGPGYIVAADYGSPGRTALEAADTVAAVAGQMLVIGPGTWIIDQDVTLAAPVKIMPGAILAIADTKTLTFTNQPEAGIYPIFSRTTTGKVAGLTTLYPEWFGAVGGGVTDDTKAFTFMIASLQSNSTVKFTKAVYLQDDLTTIQNLDNLKIEGIGNTKLTSAGAAVYAFPSHPDLRAFKFDTCNNVIVRGIDFDRAGSRTKANTNALLFYNCYNPLVENCLFSDADYGVQFLETTTYPTVRNCKFTCPLSYSAENRANNYLMRYGIIFGDKDGCHHILIENCHTTGSGVGGLFYSGVGINYVEVKSCSTRFNYDSAIYAKGSYINFHDNLVYYPGKEGIKAIGGSFPGEAISTNVTINNNTIFGTGILTGGGSIDIIASRGNVTNNIIYMAAAPFSLMSNTGIYVMGNHLLVDNNQIYFSPPINLDDWKYTVGISLLDRYQPLNYAVVSNNTISGPATGVQLFPGNPKQFSNDVTIKGNKLISNRFGIGNHCSVTNFKAYDNEIIDWQYYAVYSSAVLTGSLWENNKFLLPNIAANGVLLAENFVNTIFNNNFGRS